MEVRGEGGGVEEGRGEGGGREEWGWGGGERVNKIRGKKKRDGRGEVEKERAIGSKMSKKVEQGLD